MKTKGKIYISGSVVGISEKEIVQKFEDTERMLKKQGFEVVNPIKLMKTFPEDIRWQEALQICLTAIATCSAIYMMPCSEKCEVAQVELDKAIRDNMQIYYELENVEEHELADDVHGQK